MESFEEFFKSTGIDKEDFADAQSKAQSFGEKFKKTFGQEIQGQVEEAKERAERLDEKPNVVTGVPNSFVYFFLIAGGIYIINRLIYK